MYTTDSKFHKKQAGEAVQMFGENLIVFSYNLVVDDIDWLDSLLTHVETYYLCCGNSDLAYRPDTQQALQELKSRSHRVEFSHIHPKSNDLFD